MRHSRGRWTPRVVLAVLLLAGSLAVVTPWSAEAGEPATGVVRGRVTAADTGEPVAGACVGFFLHPAPAPTLTPHHLVHTDGNGKYEAVVPVGSYRVFFEPPTSCAAQHDYVGELYDDVTSFLEATDVEVTETSAREGVDAALARPSHVAGAVTADDGGAPLEGICVVADPDDGALSSGNAVTDVAGAYDISGLMAGHYEVRFRDCTPPVDHLFERYDDDLAEDDDPPTRVGVGVAATTGGVDAALATAGHITGTVTEDGTGRPVAGACVSPSLDPGFPGARWIDLAETGAEGTYDLGGLPAGTYRLAIYDCSGADRFSGERYDDIRIGPGTPLVLAPAETVTGIDVGVQPTCAGSTATVDLGRGERPTEGNDVILGTTGDDVIDALGGDDRVCGRGGADHLRGGSGVDLLVGARGADRLVGGPRADRLVGGSGLDDCRGGTGHPDEVTGCERQTGVP